MTRAAWAIAKAWILYGRAHEAVGRAAVRVGLRSIRESRVAERQAAIWTARALGEDVDALLARLSESAP